MGLLLYLEVTLHKFPEFRIGSRRLELRFLIIFKTEPLFICIVDDSGDNKM